MTPNNKNTVGCWLVLDDHGDTWRVQCLACDAKLAHSKRLLQSAIPPRCKCGGKVPAIVHSKPVEASKPLTPAVVPVQAVAPVLTPVAKLKGTKPALIGKRSDFEMEADRVAKPPKEPKPLKPPSLPKGHALNKDLPPIVFGPVENSRLTIVSLAPTNAWGDRRVNCVCECGNTCTTAYFRIRRRITRSCGCLWKETIAKNHTRREKQRAMPGDKHGPLTVLREADPVGKTKYRAVDCVCTCGKERTITVKRLTSLTEDRCRCYQVERPLPKGFGQPRKPPLLEESARYLRRYKRLQARIAKHEATASRLRAELDALTPPATVAQEAK
jgi:hypothetical protein